MNSHKCHRRCTRLSMSKEEYMKNKEDYGQVHCMGCHKPVFIHNESCEQFHDMDGVLGNE